MVKVTDTTTSPKMSDDDLKEFRELTEPLIKWLNENHHPHVTLIITTNSAELSEGLLAVKINKYQ